MTEQTDIPEIEITPEMTEAGHDVLMNISNPLDSPFEVVRDVYLAMELKRPSHPSYSIEP